MLRSWIGELLMISMAAKTFAYWSVCMQRSGWMRIELCDGRWHAAMEGSRRKDDAPDEYGSGIIWEEFHMAARYRC